jgi:hypothetical protein
MPFDPDNAFDPTNPSQWPQTRTPLRIVVHPKPPPSDGIDHWFVPGQADDGPDDWFVPPSSAAPSAQLPPRAQPNAAGSAPPPDPFAA